MQTKYFFPRRKRDFIKEEVDEHNLTHCPYRSWCPICVEAQGKEDPDYRATGNDLDSEVPTVPMDYQEVSAHVDGKAQLTTVVLRDKWTKDTAAMVVKANGSTECSTRLVEFLDSFGYNEIVLRSDNGIAIKLLRDNIVNQRVIATRPAGSAPMHPQTHGRAEKAVQDVIYQVRKMKLALEQRLKIALPVDLPMTHWMVEHVALLINRHLKGHDGKTAYKRKHQREAPATQLDFGEQVLARFAPKRGKSKRKLPLAPRSTPGTWVGINAAIAENIVVLQPGRAARVRIVFRKFEQERCDLEQIMKARATPTNPNPANPSEDIIVL